MQRWDIYWVKLKDNTKKMKICFGFAVFDASAKPQSGLIVGNIQNLGNIDECLDTKTGHDFLAQACSTSVQFKIMQGARSSDQLDMKDLLVRIAEAAVNFRGHFLLYFLVNFFKKGLIFLTSRAKFKR